MKISQNSPANGEIVLEIEVDDQLLDKHIRRGSQSIKIPGFRQGKVPLPILHQHVGRDYLVEQALNSLVDEAVRTAIEEQDIDAFDRPKVDVPETDPTVKIVATVPLQPSVDLADYKALRIDDAAEPVTDADVDSTLDQIRRSFAVTRGVERPAAEGDVVVFSGRATSGDDQLFDVEQREYLLDPENDIGIDGFREALIGMSAGDSTDFSGALESPAANEGDSDEPDDTAPDASDDAPDEPSADAADDANADEAPADDSDDPDADADAAADDTPEEPRIADVHLQVVEVKEMVLPDLDDELAITVGIDGVDTLDKLRNRLREDLQTERERQVRTQVEEKVIEELKEQSQFHLSTIVIQHEAGHILERELERRWQYMGGRGPKPRLEQLGPDAQPTAERIAEANLKRTLILNRIAELEDIEIDDAEVAAELERLNALARVRATAAEQEPQELQDTDETRADIRYTMRNRRAIETAVQFARSETPATDPDSDTETDPDSETDEPAPAATATPTTPEPAEAAR